MEELEELIVNFYWGLRFLGVQIFADSVQKLPLSDGVPFVETALPSETVRDRCSRKLVHKSRTMQSAAIAWSQQAKC